MPSRQWWTRASAISSATSCTGRPSATARSLVMPWIAEACSGILTPGSASQVLFRNGSSSPGVRATTAAVTILASNGSVPVVSRSKPTSGSRCQLIPYLLRGAYPQ